LSSNPISSARLLGSLKLGKQALGYKAANKVSDQFINEVKGNVQKEKD
jgi:hypothetical protein